MGSNPCILCATPGTTIKEGIVSCFGCGPTPIRAVINYCTSRVKRHKLSFADATFQYERGPFKSRISFGEWLAQFRIELQGKP